jgi:tetratricopeptide (TPR) repeat protein
MKRSLCVSLALFSAVSASVSSAQSGDPVARAQALVAQQKYDEAVKIYDDAIRKDPTYAAFHLNRGLVQLQMKKWREALNDCSAAMQLMRPTASLHYCRGAAYQNTGKTELAKESLKRALALNPNMVAAVELMAVVSRKGKDRDEAIESLTEVIRLNPDKASNYFERGRLYEKNGDLYAALDDYSDAVRLEPKESSIVARAEVLFKVGEFDRAIAAYTEMLRRSPNSAAFHIGRGKALLMKGEDAKAQVDFNAAKRFNTAYVHIIWQLQAGAKTMKRQIAEARASSITLAAVRKAASPAPGASQPQERVVAAVPAAEAAAPPAAGGEAAPVIDEAITPSRTLVLAAKKPAATPAAAPAVVEPVQVGKATPPPAPVVVETPAPAAASADATLEAIRRHLEEASNHIKANQPDQAIAAYSEALKVKPDLPATWVDRAKLYMRLGKIPLAIADFTESLKHKAAQPDVLLQRCLAYLQTNDPKSAVPDCNKAVELDPKSIDAVVARAQAYTATRQFVAAAQDLEDAIGKKNDLTDAHLQLGQLYIELEQYVLALHHFTVATQQRPGFKEAFRFRAIVKQTLGDKAGHDQDMARAKG